MNGRVNIAELADGIAKRATIPVSYAEKFVQSFFDLIEEALVREKLVKVKGLGTFKLVDVDARESVDVNTGERILLSAHSKVSFTPDAGLRDAINRPFADFETVLLNEGTPTELMEKDSSDETEATDVEVETEPVVQKAALVEPESLVTSDVVEEVQQEVVADPVNAEPAEIAAEPSDEDVVDEPETETECVDNQTPETLAEMNKNETESSEPKKMNNIIKNLLAALVCLFLGYAICYYFRPFELPTFVPATTSEKSVAESDEAKATADAETTEATEEPKAEEPAPKVENNYPQIEGGEYVIVGVLANDTMKAGKMLTKMAIQYYGDKDLYTYICKMNNIENPDIVPLNMPLVIPKLEKK